MRVGPQEELDISEHAYHIRLFACCCKVLFKIVPPDEVCATVYKRDVVWIFVPVHLMN